MLPVVVHMASDTREVFVKAPGFSDWLSYPDTLLALANGQAQGVRKPRESLPFVMDTLKRFIPTAPHVMLFYHAQNFRSAWNWLTMLKAGIGLTVSRTGFSCWGKADMSSPAYRRSHPRRKI